jgi:adenosylcobinamide kinase/adenosylcobinamide-phosphate guanylyltransferase
VSGRLVLVLGGTRSGKSRFGLERAASLAVGESVAYLATARPGDPELDRRIAGHRRARPESWPTVEVGASLATAVRSVEAGRVILVDGLTLWVSTLTGDAPPEIEALVDGPVADALAAVLERTAPVVVVSDEIGLGLVPMDPIGRAFRDLLGIVHQRFAAAADEVHFMVAGLPLTLRDR